MEILTGPYNAGGGEPCRRREWRAEAQQRAQGGTSGRGSGVYLAVSRMILSGFALRHARSVAPGSLGLAAPRITNDFLKEFSHIGPKDEIFGILDDFSELGFRQ